MRILYGVQATGQGHISRARAMAAALAGEDVAVTWLFSGRPREQLYDMAPFGDFLHRRGLSFVSRAGKIRHLATLRHNSVLHFIRDVRALDLSGYDLVVTDFEPVTAWAGTLSSDIRVVGIGHQYAFGPATPRAGHSWWAQWLMRRFAPVDLPLGLHWHPYADNVLPPILHLPALPREAGSHILVYLPFENQAEVTALLARFPEQAFVQYAPGIENGRCGNVTRHAPSVEHFKRDLATSAGVICNSGFELLSECLHWHKPVLTKPLQGQMEQVSNALALRQLGYASTTDRLDPEVLAGWLDRPQLPPRIHFPDVAAVLARWLAGGCAAPPAALARELWGRNRAGTMTVARGLGCPQAIG